MLYIRFFLIVCLLVAALPVEADDALVIKAPAESAFIDLQSSYRPSLVIDGWVCGTYGASAGQRAADLVYRLRLAESGFKKASAALQTTYESRKKTVKAPNVFRGFTTSDVSTMVDNAIKSFPKKVGALNDDLNRLKKELDASLQNSPSLFFDVEIKKRALQENHLDDKLRLASWQDDGAHQIWTTSDCYSEAELKSMQSSVAQALKAAVFARDELNKTALQIHDGKGPAFSLPK